LVLYFLLPKPISDRLLKLKKGKKYNINITGSDYFCLSYFAATKAAATGEN